MTDRPLDVLTERQVEVLALIADGLRIKEIARKLGTSDKTIQAHITAIHKRLAIHTVAGLTRYTIRQGLRTP